MLSQDTLHQDARAVAVEAASRIIADTDLDAYKIANGSYESQDARDKRRTQATLTMANEFYRFIIFGDAQV